MMIIKEYEVKQILDAQLKITEAIKKRNDNYITRTVSSNNCIDKKRKLDSELESSQQIVSNTLEADDITL